MTEITDAIRAGVLGALSRGMSLDYAARADGIRVSEAETIARAAGWPDDPLAVLAEARRMRGVPPNGLPVESLPDALGPRPAAPVPAEPRPAAQPVRPMPRKPATPRPDLSVARTPAPPRLAAAADAVVVTCPDQAAGCRTAAGRCNPMECMGSHGRAGFPEGGTVGGGCCQSCAPGDHCGCCQQFDPAKFADTPEEADAELEAALEEKTPAEWAQQLGIIMVKPRGWHDPADFRSWSLPLTRAEFERRASLSVVKYVDPPKCPECFGDLGAHDPGCPTEVETQLLNEATSGASVVAAEMTGDPIADIRRAVAVIEGQLTDELPLPAGIRVAFDSTPLIEEEPAPVVSPLVSATPDEIPQHSQDENREEPGGLRGLLAELGVNVAGKTITIAGEPLQEPAAKPPVPMVGDFPAGFREHFDLASSEGPEQDTPIGPAVQVVREEFDPDGTRRILEAKVLGMPVAASPLVQPDAVVVAVDPDRPAPKPVKRSATRAPGTLPCEACGRGVTREYVAANGGVQRHGHCREGA